MVAEIAGEVKKEADASLRIATVALIAVNLTRVGHARLSTETHADPKSSVRHHPVRRLLPANVLMKVTPVTFKPQCYRTTANYKWYMNSIIYDSPRLKILLALELLNLHGEAEVA